MRFDIKIFSAVVSTLIEQCPVCYSRKIERILEIQGLPVLCNIQLETREEALSQATGIMHLEYCADCSHIFNSAFDESLLSYSETYDNSLHFSGTFSRFARNLAGRLVEDHDLHEKKILDIGCGKGDFLALICELGVNTGFGFDKSYEEGRAKIPDKGSVTYFPEYFSKEHAHLAPDFASCRHVLEHVPNPRQFLAEIVDALRDSPGCRVYFEVPNALYTFRDLGIWDLIYEHCHYFTARSLSTALESAGVAVGEIHECYGGQFLGLEGQVNGGVVAGRVLENFLPSEVTTIIRGFRHGFTKKITKWRDEIETLEDRAVVWGGGSKGVTFLSLTADSERIAGVVDINPHKQHRYVPVSGFEILAPEDLKRIRPKHILVMNPLYEQEIQQSVRDLGLDAEVRIVR